MNNPSEKEGFPNLSCDTCKISRCRKKKKSILCQKHYKTKNQTEKSCLVQIRSDSGEMGKWFVESLEGKQRNTDLIPQTGSLPGF